MPDNGEIFRLIGVGALVSFVSSDLHTFLGLSRSCQTDWLAGRVMFDGLDSDNEFAKKRLGYEAPNIFRLNLSQY